MAVNAQQRRQVLRGELDVGRLFADTKQIYLDARANAAEFDEPRIRVDAMYAIVELLGRLIREIRVLRAEITRGEEGLAGFDEDLAQLSARYRNLYRPFFDREHEPRAWTDEQWRSLEEDLEGPILLWDLKTCQERWGIPFGTPPCEGPDLLMALSLLHQTGVATDFQQELVASLFGFANLTMKDITETYGDIAKAAGRGIADAFGSIAEGAKSYLTPTKAAKGFAWGLGVAAVVGMGGYLWINAKKKRGK
ncbi:MAG: hypothetical protein KC501_21695 [Myxococcales bacterium]|nr:hypothetical protein [Myxococcales bacterium]